MGAIWLHSLPDWLRAAGLDVETWPGWETRSRGSGGYDAIMGIGIHHDAGSSSESLNSRCQWAWQNSPDRPIGAMWLHHDGTVMIGAAGATNTQGKGGPYRTSRGMIPEDAGNRYMVSIEASNNGVGEPWPTVQQDAYQTMCRTLCDRLGLNPASDVIAHFEWTDRKIDPAGPSRWATGTDKWNMNQFRADLELPPDPPTGGTDMATMNIAKFRFDGYSDQLVSFHTSAETLNATGAIAGPVIVLPRPSAAVRAQIEAELGKPLTPH